MAYFLNIASMRRVTRNPPAMLIVANRRGGDRDHGRAVELAAEAARPEQAADDDDAADRVGHAHQRRVQRGRHVPHDLEPDEHRHHEHREVLEERVRFFARECIRLAVASPARTRRPRRARRATSPRRAHGSTGLAGGAVAVAVLRRCGGRGLGHGAGAGCRRRGRRGLRRLFGGSFFGARPPLLARLEHERRADRVVVVIDLVAGRRRPSRRGSAAGSCRRSRSRRAASGSARSV